MITAVFPAAGSSVRMGKAIKNKNFLELMGEPILVRTLKTFSKSKRVGFLIVVVGADEIDMVKKLLKKTEGLKPYAVTAGGSERQYSIANGLKLVPKNTKIILVHDAARPLVSLETIEKVIDTAEEFGGAIAAVHEKNTIKIIDDDDFVRITPRRVHLASIQTPQGFKKKILFDAYEQAAKDDFLGTDDASLVERIGAQVKVVWGDYENIKITTPEDIRIAETFLKGRNS